MRKLILPLLLVIVTLSANAQSKSYKDLRRNFDGEPEVRSIGLGAPVCRMLINIIGWEDKEMSAALRGVKHVRFMTIPTEAFADHGLSVRGFQSRLEKDSFELMASFRDDGNQFTIYHRPEKKADRYFMLMEDGDDLVAVEMKGYIDPAAFRTGVSHASL
jgi:hypothetical protein